MGRVIRASLRGGEAELGKVAAADVARLFLGLERSLARASGYVLGRQVKPTGRWGVAIETAVRLRLIAIEPGSVVGVLELPEASAEEPQLPLEAAGLGEEAWASLLATVAGTDASKLDVARSLAELAEDIGLGTRYEAVSFGDSQSDVTLDISTVDRLRQQANMPPVERSDSVVGVLVEADFENFTARLRTLAGDRIAVSFDRENADALQEALRRQAQLVGEVHYNPRTLVATSVRLRHISRADQLPLEGIAHEGFWEPLSVAQLAEERGIAPVTDARVLVENRLSGDEIDSFLAALAR